MIKNRYVKKTSMFALMVALALILSYVEVLIPIPFVIPGIKIGLANLVTIIALFKMGTVDAIIISVIRILLAAMLFGNLFGLAFSLAGGVFSLLVMILLKKTDKFSIGGVSIAGGVSHNIAQICMAALILETKEIVFYLPILLITGSVTGLLIGILGGNILKIRF
jgi:heptaprenyl diphosphate synthase